MSVPVIITEDFKGLFLFHRFSELRLFDKISSALSSNHHALRIFLVCMKVFDMVNQQCPSSTRIFLASVDWWILANASLFILSLVQTYSFQEQKSFLSLEQLGGQRHFWCLSSHYRDIFFVIDITTCHL